MALNSLRNFLKQSSFMRTGYHTCVGLLSNIFPNITFAQGTGGTVSARYCYSVFLRHLVLLHANGMKHIPVSVAELGPGDSLGIGLCYLLVGSKNYFALDLVKFSDVSKNVQIFDELIQLFQKREPIPDNAEFPLIKPELETYEFPAHILTDEILQESLSEERIAAIRNSLTGEKNEITIEYIVPWIQYKGDFPKMDLIFSQAVLEHVDDLENTYRIIKENLNNNGYSCHVIDFKSHGITKLWNGHWAYSDRFWNIIRGKRPYLINREPLSTHMKHIGEYNLNAVYVSRAEEKGNSIKRNRVAKRYNQISDEDFKTSSCFLILK